MDSDTFHIKFHPRISPIAAEGAPMWIYYTSARRSRVKKPPSRTKHSEIVIRRHFALEMEKNVNNVDSALRELPRVGSAVIGFIGGG